MKKRVELTIAALFVSCCVLFSSSPIATAAAWYEDFGGVFSGVPSDVIYPMNSCDGAWFGRDGMELSVASDTDRDKVWKFTPNESRSSIWMSNYKDWAGGESNNMDCSSYEFKNLALSFWFKIDRQENYSNNQIFAIRLVNSNSQNLIWNRWTEDFAEKSTGYAYGAYNGWVRVVLPFKEAANEFEWKDWTEDGQGENSAKFDLKTIHEFSFTMTNGTLPNANYYIDDIAVVDLTKLNIVSDPNSSEAFNNIQYPEGGRKNILHLANDAPDPQKSNWQLNTEKFTEGTGSYEYEFPANQQTSVLLSVNDGAQLAQYNNADAAWLCLDLYIEDVSNLQTGEFQIALYSNDIPTPVDDQRSAWWVKKAYSGWNRLILPINNTENVLKLGYADAVNNGGALYTDPLATITAANQLRLIMQFTKKTTVYLDNVFVYSIGADDPINFAKEPTGLQVDLSSAKTECETGSELDLSGLIVKYMYSNGTYLDVTEKAELDLSKVNVLKAGTYPVLVSYGGFETEFQVTIKKDTLVSEIDNTEQEPSSTPSQTTVSDVAPSENISPNEQTPDTGVFSHSFFFVFILFVAGVMMFSGYILTVNRKKSEK